MDLKFNELLGKNKKKTISKKYFKSSNKKLNALDKDSIKMNSDKDYNYLNNNNKHTEEFNTSNIFNNKIFNESKINVIR